MQIRTKEKDVCKGNAYSKGQKFDPSLWVSFRLQSEMMTYSIEYSHVSAFYVFLSLQMFKIYPHNVSFILCIEVLSEILYPGFLRQQWRHILELKKRPLITRFHIFITFYHVSSWHEFISVKSTPMIHKIRFSTSSCSLLVILARYKTVNL